MGKRIGCFVCECGPNIKDNLHLDRLIDTIARTTNVVVAKPFGLLCSPAGKQFLQDEIAQHELTGFVVGGCSPRQHEQTFMAVCEQAGLNPFLFQLVNIREQCAWIVEDKDAATEKAARALRAAIRRVQSQNPLQQVEIEACPDVLVIGGGIAGLEASLSLADGRRKIHLVERQDSLGGALAGRGGLFDWEISGEDLVQDRIQRIEQDENIQVTTNCEVEEILGFLGSFQATIRQRRDGKETKLEVGAVVLATGFALKTLPEITESIITVDRIEDHESIPGTVALVHCAGRAEVGYCSGVCCRYSLRLAHHLRQRWPDCQVTELHTDLCLPGQHAETLLQEARTAGVELIYSTDLDLQESGREVIARFQDFSGQAVERRFGLAVLAPAMVPSPGTVELAEMLNIELDQTGFFREAHEKLDPVSSTVEGIYIVGCAQAPQSVRQTLVQAGAVSGKILASLVPGQKLEPEQKISEIQKNFCIGCQQCISVCGYGAISFDHQRRYARVNEVLCRGCGSCAAACPSGAARHRHFTPTQVYQEIIEALR